MVLRRKKGRFLKSIWSHAATAVISSSIVALVTTGATNPAMSATTGFVLTQRSTRMGDQYVYIGLLAPR